MIRITRSGSFALLVASALRDSGTAVEIGTGTITMQTTERIDFGPVRKPYVPQQRRVAQWKTERQGRRS